MSGVARASVLTAVECAARPLTMVAAMASVRLLLGGMGLVVECKTVKEASNGYTVFTYRSPNSRSVSVARVPSSIAWLDSSRSEQRLA